MAWWNRSKTVAPPPGPDSDASTTPLLDLKRRLDSLELAYDDLHDQFRRFRARVTKRQSLDEGDREGAPAVGAPAGARPVNGALPSIAQLRASGRWPLKG